jgi:two-component system chemotaxis response regulator CheB
LSALPDRPRGAEKSVRVLVCEDSKTDREILLRLLVHDPDIDVVAIADRGEDVLPYVERLAPDLITLDINLPGKSGIEVIDEIMAKHPIPILVISGQADDSKVAIEALAAGAVEVISKPQINSEADFEYQAARLAELVGTLSKVKVIRHLRAKLPSAETGRDKDKRPGPSIEITAPAPKMIVGLAASTGGPQALRTVLSEIGSDLAAPVLVVQHIAKGFTASFVEWLSAVTGAPAKLAEDGESLRNGVVYVGPEEYHMIVRGGRIALEAPEPNDKHCPSADRLFASMAEEVGSGAVCVILTGMGNDGAVGAAAAQHRGGRVIVQDESSSVVFGMPKAAVDAGVATTVAPLDKVAASIVQTVKEGTDSATSAGR